MTRYPGGKGSSGVAQKIINQMPPHKIYIEGFAGGATILKLKRPADRNIAIDLDPAAVGGLNDLKGVELYIADCLIWLAAMRPGPDALVYLDPPYLRSTRKNKDRLYNFEFWSAADHNRLVDLILGLDCMVMLSGYSNWLYSARLASWRTIQFNSMTRAGRPALETVWLNFPQPAALHDYRFLGDNYRERENFKKQQKRWRAALVKMPAARRYALLSVLEESSAVPPDPAVLAKPGCTAGSGDRISE
jgi:DNA adenine methylase